MTREDIIRIVREHLERHPLDGISLTVLDDLVRADNEWWHVPVQPSRQPKSTIPYYDVLATVEEEILEDEDVDVLLVPTAPES